MEPNSPIEPSAFEARWRARFKSFAETNEDDAGIAGWSSTGLQTRLRYFISIWPGDNAGSVWLDAGCGAGSYTQYLASRQMQVLGLDYSLPSVIKAKSRDKYKSCWGIGDVNFLPIKAGSMDGVLCFGVTQALATSSGALKELARVVRPGGQVWVDALNARCLPHILERVLRKLKGRPVHVRYEFKNKLKRDAFDAGLIDVEVYWLPILPRRLQRFQWILETSCVRRLLHTIPPLGSLISHSFVVYARRPL